MTIVAVEDRYPTRRPGIGPEPQPRLDPVVWGESLGPLRPVTSTSTHRTASFRSARWSPVEEAGELLAEAHRLADDPARRGDERTIIEPDSDEVRSVFDVHQHLAALRRDRRRPTRGGHRPSTARIRRLPPPDPHQPQAGVHRQGVRLALRLRDVARRGRHARDACREHLARAHREPRVQRPADDHPRVAPDASCPASGRRPTTTSSSRCAARRSGSPITTSWPTRRGAPASGC